MKKPWWQSKTIWLAVLQALAGLVVIPTVSEKIGGALLAKSIIDVLLRVVTNAGVTATPDDPLTIRREGG